MASQSHLGLFEGYGVELEYMLVDRDTLAVRPLVDALLHAVAGTYVSDFENGDIVWSNELVNHVIELKTNGPAPRLAGLVDSFLANVTELNRLLADFNVCLMPTGAHPWMDPYSETRLWPHEFGDVYMLYDRLFDTRGNGWANLQSTHLNLSFAGDAEFGRLHAAIRVLLPILPALSASSPILDARYTGYLDSRLEMYRHNQRQIPVLTGNVIPEAVFTEAAYRERIHRPIETAMAPFDPDRLLNPEFMNSRGAIARFDRGSIEIRVLDIQECPGADFAILSGVVAVLKALIAGRWADLESLRLWGEEDLAALWLQVIRSGEHTTIMSHPYLELFGFPSAPATARELWMHLLDAVAADLAPDDARVLRFIVQQGSLASRIVGQLGPAPTRPAIHTLYRQMTEHLATNTLLGS